MITLEAVGKAFNKIQHPLMAKTQQSENSGNILNLIKIINEKTAAFIIITVNYGMVFLTLGVKQHICFCHLFSRWYWMLEPMHMD